MGPEIDDARRTQLIRKGNELYNSGDIEMARRCFVTAGYIDGIIRVADRYSAKGRLIDAMLLYRKADCREKLEELYEKAAAVIHELLQQDGAVQDKPVLREPGDRLLDMLRNREEQDGRQ